MSSSRKPSLFARKMQSLRQARTTIDQPVDSAEPASVFGDRSFIVMGKEAEAIHSDNIALLSKMSRTEIEEKREELLKMLNPSTVDFLRKRRKTTASTGLESPFSSLSTQDSLTSIKTRIKRKHVMKTNDITENYTGNFKVPSDVSESEIMDIDPTDQQNQSKSKTEDYAPTNVKIDLELKDKGVHMNVVEPEKLKWMEEIPTITKPLPDTVYNARFDFEGDLLPYVEEDKSTCDKGLYHHGDEPQRPGYTIEELYQLTRSSLPKQRIVALNTLAAILEKEFVLSSCLETELLKELLESGIFLIIRFSLDEKLKPVYLAALRAISALLWRSLDMHYLSDMVGIFGDMRLPTFEVNHEVLKSDSEDELKDIELIGLDVIKGALRTDIIQRFRYLIDDPLLEVDHYLSIIKCLTRIAYHSDEAAAVILETPSLLEVLFLHRQYPMNFEKLYTAKLMILFRVIACRSAKFAAALASRLNLVPFLLSVIGDATTKTSTVSQCIYLWLVLLHQCVAPESVSEFSPTFCTLLSQLFSIQLGNLQSSVITFATALITLLAFLFDHFRNTVLFLVPTLERLCCQWINVIVNEKQLPREFVKLASNTIHLLTTVSSEDAPLSSFHAQITAMVDTPAYRRLAAELQSCSFLLNTSKKNYVPSMPTLSIPASILTSSNSVLLVHSVLRYALKFDQFVDLDPVWPYVTAVMNQSTLSEVASLWPARYEISFLCDILTWCSHRKVSIDRRLLQLAFTLVRIIHADDARRIEDILGAVICNAEVYQRIVGTGCQAVDVLGDLESMEQLFAAELRLPKTNAALTSTARGTECALPTDWYYMPILRISNAKSDGVDVAAMKLVLRWLHLIECMADDIKTDMTLAARYCRVCCVFFCGDVFLEVTDVLRDILREMLKHNDRLEFKRPVPGVSSFYDFYCELCEQFVSSSYCNPVFAAYVLVPLQQRHDCRIRQYAWTEQAVMLRFLQVRQDQLLVPIECYLQPCETNLQLVGVYLRMIATGRVTERTNPVLFLIGLHHVATFIRTFEDEVVAKRLKQKVNSLGNQELKNRILNYVPSPSG